LLLETIKKLRMFPACRDSLFFLLLPPGVAI